MVTTTRYYASSIGQPRISLDQLRTRANALVSVECPRLLAGRLSAFGETDFTVDVSASGAVLRAHVDRGSGDSRIDDIFGGLAAQLRLDPPSSTMDGMARRRIGIGYSCSTTEAVATIQLNPK